MLKKVVPILVILLFVIVLALFAYSFYFKNSNTTYWGNQTSLNGYWLVKENTNIAGYKVLERTSGYLTGFTQEEGSPYFLTLKIFDDVKNTTTEVKIPRNMNSDNIKLTVDEIVSEVAKNNATGIVVGVVRDLRTGSEYLDFINYIKKQ